MSIEQLIATQHSRNAGPSMMERLSGIEGLKSQQLQNSFNQERLGLIGQERDEQRRTQGLKFAANVARQIRSEPDFGRKAEIYQSAREFARMNGHSMNNVPEQYGDEAQYMLDVAEAQVYEPQRLMQYDQIVSQLPEQHRQPFIALAQADPKKAVDFASSVLKPNRSLVTINNAKEKALTKEQTALAETRVKRYDAIEKESFSAIEQNNTLSQLKNLDVTTGFGEEAKVELSRVITALGGDGDKLLGVDTGNAQIFLSKANELLVDVLAEQTGTQTKSDADTIRLTFPQIKNDGDANRFIITSLMAVNNRKIEKAKYYEQYLSENETLEGADKQWREFVRTTPLVSNKKNNPKTGLPFFYDDFEEEALNANPDATKEQILNAWRKRHQ